VIASGAAQIRAQRIGHDEVQTEVVLHVVGDVRNGEGEIWELEVWPTAEGEQTLELPPINELHFVDP
jgi:hypothetical protein